MKQRMEKHDNMNNKKQEYKRQHTTESVKITNGEHQLFIDGIGAPVWHLLLNNEERNINKSATADITKCKFRQKPYDGKRQSNQLRISTSYRWNCCSCVVLAIKQRRAEHEKKSNGEHHFYNFRQKPYDGTRQNSQRRTSTFYRWNCCSCVVLAINQRRAEHEKKSNGEHHKK